MTLAIASTFSDKPADEVTDVDWRPRLTPITMNFKWLTGHSALEEARDGQSTAKPLTIDAWETDDSGPQTVR